MIELMALEHLRTLREEWRVVKTAPWSFAVVGIIALGIGYGVATYWWSGTVSTVRERLAFAQDELQIALAHPANPAAALLTAPENNGRRLSEKEKQCLVSEFKDSTKGFLAIVVSAFSTDESQKYATDFSTLFLRMGYQSGVLPGSPHSYDDTGVIVGFKVPEKPSDLGKKFKELIGACIKLNDRSLIWGPPLPPLLPQLAAIDFDLFIGPKD
jgi:hypothetical protein